MWQARAWHFKHSNSFTLSTILRGWHLYPHFADSRGNDDGAQCGPKDSCSLSPASGGQTVRLREVQGLSQGHPAGTEGAGFELRADSKASLGTGI